MRNGELKNVERPSMLTSRIADTVRHAQRSAEARRLRSKAEEALHDGLYETRRALKVIKRRAEAFEHKAEYYVKREPRKALAVAAGFALFLGFLIGYKSRPKPRRLFGAVV
jgi:ElaB/YqjD/DUF883 family membrane-anchored ribosome-binding protein